MTDFEEKRRIFERRVLPNMLMMQGSALFQSILDKEGKFFTDYMAVMFGVTDPGYKADGFKIYLQRAKSGKRFFNFLMIRQPESGVMTIADTVYLCNEETSGEVRYFLAAKSLGNVRKLVEVVGEEETDHGEIPDDPDKEFQKMANIFIRSFDE